MHLIVCIVWKLRSGFKCLEQVGQKEVLRSSLSPPGLCSGELHVMLWARSLGPWHFYRQDHFGGIWGTLLFSQVPYQYILKHIITSLRFLQPLQWENAGIRVSFLWHWDHHSWEGFWQRTKFYGWEKGIACRTLCNSLQIQFCRFYQIPDWFWDEN